MNKATALFFATLSTTTSFALQGEPHVSEATKQYREYRYQYTEPAYGLKKVKALIKGIKPNPKDEDDIKLTDAAFNRLTTAEKFTYCMLHGEIQSQNCDGMPWIVGEEKKIFAQMPGFFNDEQMWSPRQISFLKNRRSQVIGLLRSTIRQKGRVGANFKETITTIHATELIPDLVKVYNKDHKDQDILTVFAILMKDGNYQPFMKSASYTKLYGKDANYQSFIDANVPNQKLMIARVTDFYKSRKR